MGHYDEQYESDETLAFNRHSNLIMDVNEVLEKAYYQCTPNLNRVAEKIRDALLELNAGERYKK